MLVSAAAGSGKTAVLVESILRQVTEEEVPLSSMLVVTFTEAAASEMKQKLADQIEKYLDENENTRLRRELQQIGSANISTFHSFSLNIIKRYFYIIDASPSLNVIDDFSAEMLKTEAMDRLFEEAFESGDTEFTDFLHSYATAKSEFAVREMIEKTYSFIRNGPAPFEWLEDRYRVIADGRESIKNSKLFGSIKDSVIRELTEGIETLKSIGQLLDESGCPLLEAKNETDLEKLQLAYDTFCRDGKWDEAGDLISFKFSTFRATKAEKESYELIKDTVSRRRKSVKDILKDLSGKFFKRSLDEMLEDVARTAIPNKCLIRLLKRYDELYTELKTEEDYIDFADIEHLALKILENEEVCSEWREKLEYIFIDEYQDSNYLQDALISRICRKDNVFMVGDIKQSIYKFRNAEPEIFIEKYKKFPSLDFCSVVDLNSNFRSKSGVIECVNAVFKYLMSERYSLIPYDENAMLKMAVRCENKWHVDASLHLVDKSLTGACSDESDEAGISEGDDITVAMKDAEREAIAAASIIKSTKKENIFDVKAGEVRNIKNSDIVILLREVKNFGIVYAETLNSLGIEAYTESGDGYLDAVEIETFLNLLRAIDNPRRDIALAGTLYSPVFGFTINELVQIRAAYPEGNFYESFLDYIEPDNNDPLRMKCLAAIKRLDSWRDDEHFMELSDFLWMLMRDSGYFDYAGALTGGAIRQANLRALLSKAGEFQTGHVRRLFSFLKYIENIKDRKLSIPPARLITESDNVVRVMTIHQSKGLEFPVVIVGGLAKPLKGRGGSNKLSLHREVGLAFTLENPDAHSYRPTLITGLADALKSREESEEQLRILYVAMTRAMDRLVLLGSIKDTEKKLDIAAEEDLSLINPYRMSSYLNMILPILKQEGTDIFVYGSDDLVNILSGEITETTGNIHSWLDEEIRSIKKDKLYESINNRLSSVYPYSEDVGTKSKYSVTELSKSDREEDLPKKEFTDTPGSTVLFMEGSEEESLEDEGRLIDAAERGIAIHKVLEKLDYPEALKNKDNRQWFIDFLDSLEEQGKLNEDERKALSEDSLKRYAATELFERAAKSAASGNLRKEAHFIHRLNRQGREIILQGVIDCFFEEEGELVLIDFKSGNISKNMKVYNNQINLYKKALSEIFGKKIKESVLYLFDTGKTIRIPNEHSKI